MAYLDILESVVKHRRLMAQEGKVTDEGEKELEKATDLFFQTYRKVYLQENKYVEVRAPIIDHPSSPTQSTSLPITTPSTDTVPNAHSIASTVSLPSVITREVEPQSVQESFACQVCGMRFRLLGNRNQHAREVHGGKVLPCLTCGVRFKRPYNVIAHARQVHLQMGRLTCEVCGEQFSRRFNLQRHIRRFHHCPST